jgi:hypothetical protein
MALVVIYTHLNLYDSTKFSLDISINLFTDIFRLPQLDIFIKYVLNKFFLKFKGYLLQK